jgi:putative ABC transport system permease protein
VTFLGTWVTALRVARREARRSKGRSAMVVVMIAFPVLGLAFAAVSYDMFTLTPGERADRVMGTADARVRWDYRGPVAQDLDGNAWPESSGDPNVGGGPGEGGGEPTEAELRTRLPAGSTTVPLRRGTVRLRTAEGVGDLNAVIVDASHPLTHGFFEVLEGRAPRGPSEVALSVEAVGRLGQTIGRTIGTADGAHRFTVVGLVEFPSLLEQVSLFAPEAEPVVQRYGGLDRTWLVDSPTPLDWNRVRDLNRLGIGVASRAVFLDPPPEAELASAAGVPLGDRELALGVVVGGLGLLEVVLLAGPAFAVSARRRQRQLALVAANGGTPAHVRRIVLADGVVLGLAGAAVGIALGIVAAFIGRPFLEGLINARAGAYRVFPLALTVIAGLAVVIGLLAALVPAFITARQDVVTALAGRRGAIRSRKRWLFLGIGMAAAGTALAAAGTFTVDANVLLAGLVVGELGLVLCTPALVGLIARFGRVVPLALRIALRDAGRNRAAAAPAISAVMAAVAGSVAVGLFFSSEQAAYAELTTPLPVGTVTVTTATGEDGQPASDPATVEAIVRTTLPVTAIHRVSRVGCAPETAEPAARICRLEAQLPVARRCPYQQIVMDGTRALTPEEVRAARRDPRCHDPYAGLGTGQVLVDDGSALAAITDASPEDVAAATAVLRSGGVVVRDASYVEDGRMTFAVLNRRPTEPVNSGDDTVGAPRMSFPAYLLTTGNAGAPPIVSPKAITRAGLDREADRMIIETTRPPTQAELDRLRQRLETLDSYVDQQEAPRQDLNLMLWVLAGAAGLVTIGAAGIATGLAAADGRADLSTLAAVGASPRLRRGLSLSQSGVIAGLGSLLGAAAGMGAAVAIVVALNQRYADVWPGPPEMPILVPWVSLAVSLLIVPLVAMLGAGMITRSRLPIERRT